jgi:hypothetical protein
VVVEAGELGLSLFIGAKVSSPAARSFLQWEIFPLGEHLSNLSSGELATYYSSCSSSSGRRRVGAMATSLLACACRWALRGEWGRCGRGQESEVVCRWGS